jgi:uncharacterized membrane protein
VARAARIVAAVLLALPLFSARVAAADDGWTITSFDAQIEIQSDGRLLITETIDVDFASLQKHGIFRDIPIKYSWPAEPRKLRVYELQVLSVTDAQGRPWKYETQSGGTVRIQIGDADKTVSGRQQYRISYLVRGALNAFADHDELFWNVTGGDWTVPILRSSATVKAPAAFSQTTCFIGLAGSAERCSGVTATGQAAQFTTGRALTPGQQLTIVAALPKGVVAEPRPILQDQPRELEQFFELTPAWLALAVFVSLGGLALVARRWYTSGRDDRERETIVPEFGPPDKLRPAQVGLLMDERADTLDVTATIVDLAVRGYLVITEIPKAGILGARDWLLTRKPNDDTKLQPYERTILDGLFASGGEVRLSALRRHFYTTLAKAQSELYKDAVARGWFPADPSRVRATYAAVGVACVVIAGMITAALGALAGGGLVGIAAGVPAVALIAVAPVMPRKTRQGAELFRRSRGFERYMQVAEKDRQAFAEKEQIFAEYLPFAIVFRCVERWARAFEGIDLKEATSGWYAGSLNTFTAMNMSRDLSSFSEQISTAIASTPGGSGSSGFSGGGGSGGGGGGGGGGSW